MVLLLLRLNSCHLSSFLSQSCFLSNLLVLFFCQLSLSRSIFFFLSLYVPISLSLSLFLSLAFFLSRVLFFLSDSLSPSACLFFVFSVSLYISLSLSISVSRSLFRLLSFTH